MAFLSWKWILPSVLVVLLAWLAQNPNKEESSTASSPSNPPADTTVPEKTQPSSSQQPEKGAVYVIGDLHGDVECARHWVKTTGLIRDDKWLDSDQFLVFVGDYLDKGPQSKQVLEFVKSLTDQFPSQVIALMGNHEMELLLDRDERRHQVWGGAAYYQLAYSSVHPGEYRNYLPPHVQKHPEDEKVIEALYNASIEVYGHGKHREFRISPSISSEISALQYVPLEMRDLVQERLEVFQKHYIDTFRTATELGKWLEERPVLALVQGTLFVHGGLSGQGAGLIKAAGGVHGVNDLLQKHSQEDKLLDFIQNTEPGRVVYDMLTFRGNHQRKACPYLPQLLQVAGATRLGVGHTPGDSVRLMCEEQFLALDSALGRWFRASGNDYCPGEREQYSSNGRYHCEAKVETCEGQIVKIDARDGQIHVVHGE